MVQDDTVIHGETRHEALLARFAAYVTARTATIAGVALVVIVAAVVSYSHTYQFAHTAHESWRSWFIPLSIDGLTIAASATMLARRQAHLPIGTLAPGAFGCGIIVSIVINIADAAPDSLVAKTFSGLTPVVLAGWTPLAVAVGMELIREVSEAVRLLRPEMVTAGTPASRTTPESALSSPSPPALEERDTSTPRGAITPSTRVSVPRREPLSSLTSTRPGRTTQSERSAESLKRRRRVYAILDGAPDTAIGVIARREGVSLKTIGNYKRDWKADRESKGSAA